jgi:hypothetical protein
MLGALKSVMTAADAGERRRWPSGAALCALALLLAAPPALDAQGGYRVAHRNLAELVAGAATIVHGRVLSVRIEPHPQYQGLQTAVVTIEIIELLKGRSGAPYSFRQYVLDQQDAASFLVRYKPGQEVLLLMHDAHPQTGFSSPVGMEQGRFRIARDAQGNRVLANGYNNGALFRGLDPATNPKLQSLSPQARAAITQHRGGPILYDDLKAIILALAAN